VLKDCIFIRIPRNGAKFGLTNSHGNTAFLVAVGIGQVPMVELLLKHGADVKAVNKTGKGALSFATRRYETPEAKAFKKRMEELGASK
jgi:ankyrin repeat protein